MPRSTVRKLEVWNLHVRNRDERIDYHALFRVLSRMRADSRTWSDGERLLAIPRLRVEGDLVRIIAYEGPVGIRPLIFNTRDASEREAQLSAREVVVTKTHVLIDLSTREAYIEYNHRGAKARDIALVLEEAAHRRTALKRLTVEFAPRAAESFGAAIDEFERLRVASVRLTRPNYDWTDWESQLAGAAEESDAQKTDVTFTAARDETLSKSRGLVAQLRDIAHSPLTFVKNASVVGRRPDDAGETKVSLQRHTEHRKVRVEATPTGNATDADIERELEEFRDERQLDSGHD